MARIGLKYPVAAKIDSESPTTVPTYETGFSLGHAVEANVSIESSDVELWADDMIVETDQSFAGGTIDMNVDHLADLTYAKLCGHTVVNESGVDVIVAKTTDAAPYFGVGYVRVLKKNGVRKYRATWLYKTQFSEPADEGSTKGRTIEFATEAISGKIMELANGQWKDRATFASELDAKAWIDARAGLIGVVNKAALSAKIDIVEALLPEDYTSATWGPMYMSLQNALAIELDADTTQAKVDAALADLTAKQTALVEA